MEVDILSAGEGGFRTLTSFVRLIVIRIKNHRVLKQCQCLSDKYYKVDECYWNLVREAG